jgi:hypothetical protein
MSTGTHAAQQRKRQRTDCRRACQLIDDHESCLMNADEVSDPLGTVADPCLSSGCDTVGSQVPNRAFRRKPRALPVDLKRNRGDAGPGTVSNAGHDHLGAGVMSEPRDCLRRLAGDRTAGKCNDEQRSQRRRRRRYGLRRYQHQRFLQASQQAVENAAEGECKLASPRPPTMISVARWALASLASASAGSPKSSRVTSSGRPSGCGATPESRPKTCACKSLIKASAEGPCDDVDSTAQATTTRPQRPALAIAQRRASRDAGVVS